MLSDLCFATQTFAGSNGLKSDGPNPSRSNGVAEGQHVGLSSKIRSEIRGKTVSYYTSLIHYSTDPKCKPERK